MFEIRAAIGDGGTLIADAQDPSEAQAKPFPMAAQIAKPLTGWVALVHLQKMLSRPCLDSWLVPPSRPMLWAAVVHAGTLVSIPAPLDLCLDAMRCSAGVYGVIGMRTGRCLLAGQVLVFSGVAQCLKQSRSCGLMARMATSWGSLVVVAASRFRLVGLSGFVRVNSSIRQHRVEKAFIKRRPQGWISKLIRRTLDSPLTEAQARGWWGLQGSSISVDARPLDTPSSAAILLTNSLQLCGAIYF